MPSAQPEAGKLWLQHRDGSGWLLAFLLPVRSGCSGSRAPSLAQQEDEVSAPVAGSLGSGILLQTCLVSEEISQRAAPEEPPHGFTPSSRGELCSTNAAAFRLAASLPQPAGPGWVPLAAPASSCTKRRVFCGVTHRHAHGKALAAEVPSGSPSESQRDSGTNRESSIR